MATPDPILMRAVRKMVETQARATKAGVSLGPAALDDMVRTLTEGKYNLDDARRLIAGFDTSINASNLIRSAAQGLSFGFADEAASLFGGDEEKERIRLANTLFKQAHPKADIAAQLVGGLGAGGAVARYLPALKNMSRLGKLATGAATGAGAASLQAAGEADEGHRGEAAANVAIPGALVGVGATAVAGGLGTIGKYIGEALSPARRAEERLVDAAIAAGKKAPGLPGTPLQRGVQFLRNQYTRAATAGRGDDVMLADLSPKMRSVLDFAANANDDVATDVAERVYGRMHDASDRLLGDVRLLAGDDHAPTRLAELVEMRRTFANSPEGYAGLRARNPVLRSSTVASGNAEVALTQNAEPLAEILNRPVVKQAIRKARKTGMIGNMKEGPELSFSHLQDVKEALDDAVESAFANKKGNLGTRLKEARDALVEQLETRVPDYPRVAAKYREMKGLEAALQQGVEAYRMHDSRGLKQLLATFTPQQLREFRRGMISALIEDLRAMQTNRDAAARLVNASQSLQDKLKIVFGDENVFREFMRRVQWEKAMADTRSAVGNSATARRLAEYANQSDVLGPVVDNIVGGNPTGVVTGALRSLFRDKLSYGRGRLATKTARELAPKIMAQGEDIERVLAELAERSARKSRATRAGYVATIPLAGLLTSGQ